MHYDNDCGICIMLNDNEMREFSGNNPELDPVLSVQMRKMKTQVKMSNKFILIVTDHFIDMMMFQDKSILIVIKRHR